MSFNWEIYRELNPDLTKAGLKSKEQFENHYKIYGIREKRKTSINEAYSDFNPITYKNKYSDLSHLTAIQASLHWLKNGRYEKRSYTNVTSISYKNSFIYDANNRPNKLLYSLVFKNSLEITINNIVLSVNNNGFKYNNKLRSDIVIQNKNKLLIRNNNNRCNILVNNVIVDTIDTITNIQLTNNNTYRLNIVFPISLAAQSKETHVNFDYIIHKYLKYIKENNFQLTICHTEKTNYAILDKIILENDINYIFIVNPLNFNLGYARNIYKYVNLANTILYNDIDIPLDIGQINKMLSKIDNYDIVKPYINNLYNLTYEDKYKYINKNGNININNYQKYSKYSITGGITLFKNSVLVETGGYEEFNSYGYEDRCFDVVVLAKNYKIFYFDDVVYHLFHEKNNTNGKMILYLDMAKKYTIDNYGCGINYGNKSMHDQCNHNLFKINNMINKNKLYNAKFNLFKTSYKTINLKPL